MSEEHKEDTDDRGALVLPPKPVARGAFALLVPGNMRWRVSEFAGGCHARLAQLPAHPLGIGRSREHRCRDLE